MTRTVLIDDETHCLDDLELLLSRYNGSITIVGKARSVDEGIALVREKNPDLVFLDIQIGDKTGFDFLEAMAPLNFEVIFTTAHDQYAVQAFRFSALDYLLKPIDKEDLNEALGKLQAKSTVNYLEQKMEVLMHNLKGLDSVRKITVPTSDGYEFLEVSEIVRCRSDVNYTEIYLKDGKKLTVAKTLKYFEELLAPENFFRVHNSHLINLKEVKRYIKGKGGYVTLNDDSIIEVSTRRKEEFLNQLKSIF